MSIASVWPFVLINGACFALAWLLLARSPFYRELIDGPEAGRAEMIDGLRGWLALGVFFEHVADAWSFRHGGPWEAVDAPFYQLTGPVAVSLFFMITGFLFWGRVLRSEGRLDAPKLYRSRLRRLAPMYLASVVLSLSVVAALSGFQLHESLGRLAHEVRPWFSFGFTSTGEVNGIADAHHINAVYWTLAYEWGFYLALPFLAVFARGPAGVALFLVAVAFGTSTPILLNFAGGALVAVLAYHRRLPPRLASPALGVVPLAALAAVYGLGLDHPLADVTLLTVFFAFVAGGNSLFGLLSSRPAKLLGTVSYSIYLLHSIVLFCALQWVDARSPIAAMAALDYWVLAALAALITVLASAFTYRWCEHPFLKPASGPGPVAKGYAAVLSSAKPATFL